MKSTFDFVSLFNYIERLNDTIAIAVSVIFHSFDRYSELTNVNKITLTERKLDYYSIFLSSLHKFNQ